MIAVMLFAAACNWGTRPETLAPANGPQGVRVAVRVRDESADHLGELYAVDSIGVIFRENALIRVSWARLAAMDVKGMGPSYDIGLDEAVTPAKRAKIAPLSRFPQGLDAALLRSVLSALNQPALEEVR